jgi:hypothetical protein
MVRQRDATMQPTPQDDQLMSKHRVLGFEPQLRLEWRGQDGQNETEQPDHSANLGDSTTASTRMRFSVHTADLPRRRTSRTYSLPPNSRRATPPICPGLIYDRHRELGVSLRRIAKGKSFLPRRDRLKAKPSSCFADLTIPTAGNSDCGRASIAIRLAFSFRDFSK